MLLVTSFVMTLIAVGVAVLGFLNPSAVPLCFQPERSGQTVVVCPTQQSDLVDQQAHSVLDTVRRKKRAS